MSNKNKKQSLRKPLSSDEIMEEIFNQSLYTALSTGTDISCVLIGAAVIENTLMNMLSRFLVKCDESTALFDIKGELDSLSSCNRMALCLGLEDRLSYDNIKLIARIRNVFAHNHLPIDFENNDVKGLCRALTFRDIEREQCEKLATTLRIRFSMITAGEFHKLQIISWNIIQLKEYSHDNIIIPYWYPGAPKS